MGKLLTTFTCISLLLLNTTMIPSEDVKSLITADTKVKNNVSEPIVVSKEEIERLENINVYNNFKSHIGTSESGNDYTNDKNMPYWGCYQIGPSARETINLNISWNEFKSNPELQDYALYKLLEFNEDAIGYTFFEAYVGTIIDGVEITKSGLLAAAHLAGADNVKMYLLSNGKYILLNGFKLDIKHTKGEKKYNSYDRFGTRISDYIKEFANYDFNLNVIGAEYVKRDLPVQNEVSSYTASIQGKYSEGKTL